MAVAVARDNSGQSPGATGVLSWPIHALTRVAIGGLSLASCADPSYQQVDDPISLSAYENPFGPDDPRWSPQPRRQKPTELVVTPGGKKAYVVLPGTSDEPGDSIAVVDLESGRVLRRIGVGRGPTGMALHPDGDLLVVLNRYSNFVSVIDVNRDKLVHSPGVDFYASRAIFSPDGDTLYISNRWRDSVARWQVERDGPGLRVLERDEPGIRVGSNPRDLALSADGNTLAVASLGSLTLSLIDTATQRERHRIEVGAPSNDVAIWGDFVFVATLSASTHHYPHLGPDTNGDGEPGDGTPNINFQDLQNEIAVYSLGGGEELWRYTSDTICCKDYRDVDPLDTARGGDLLPPQEHWIVAGALPEQLAIATNPGAGDRLELLVTYAGSDALQRFEIDGASGALSPLDVWATPGHEPHDVAIADDRVILTHRLSETLTVHDFQGALHHEVVVGDTSGGEFPATDAEIGELFNFVTAPFTVDGDQSCGHCHREGGNIAKAFSMPLTRYPGRGMRMTMAYRGAADTRPWFFESAMDETNFRPVMNEFARIENFCCADYTLWPDGAPAGCKDDPPAECTEAPNTGSLDGVDPSRGDQTTSFPHPRPTGAATRDVFFLEAANQTMDRQRSFGDGLYFEDPITSERLDVPLDFEGITEALGLFLLTDTSLLPNPNDPDTQIALRGRAIFESTQTGCSVCHPAPSFAVSTEVNPAGIPVVMGPVVTPLRAEDGTNLDLFADGLAQTSPRAEMDSCEAVCGEEACAADPWSCDDLRNVRFGVPSLRGLWDRAPMFLHDGRAKSLREVLCTPGHVALQPGETGYNERDGVVDTHGGTSHLSAQEIEDLSVYILSL